MDKDIFKSGNKVPQILEEMVAQSVFEAMEPGESTWTVPWAIRVDSTGRVHINKKMVERGRDQGGTVQLKIVKDFDGVYVDATAASIDDLEKHFAPTERMSEGLVGVSEDDFEAVGGVLYPNLDGGEGLDPTSLATYNAEQQDVRKRFANYFRTTYHEDYVFADRSSNP